MSVVLLDNADKCPYKGCMKSKRQEIADAGMVSRSAVDKAVARGTLDDESLVSIASYVMAGRLSAGSAMANVTGLSPEFSRESDKCPQEEGDVGRGHLSGYPEGFIPSYDDGQDQG